MIFLHRFNRLIPLISTRYLSLELANPIVIASSPLTADIRGLRRCQEAGAAAVVLKSIFEEQIESQVEGEVMANEQYLAHSDAASYFEAVSKDYYVNRYLDFLRQAKDELTIPVIVDGPFDHLSYTVDPRFLERMAAGLPGKLLDGGAQAGKTAGQTARSAGSAIDKTIRDAGGLMRGILGR